LLSGVGAAPGDWRPAIESAQPSGQTGGEELPVVPQDRSRDNPPTGAPPPRRGVFSVAVVVGLAAWMALTAGDLSSLIIGLPTVLAAASVAVTAGLGAAAPRLGALLAFLPLFAVALLTSAWGLARRVLARDPQFRPGMVAWRLRLVSDGARAAFMNAVSLTPGTLSASLDGDVLSVHVLDTTEDVGPSLALLERQVARLYGETLA
jgi:multicomponent Na+:H+ antiporter subunit E